MNTKQLMLIAIFAFSTTISTYAFEVGGIYYQKTSDSTVEVTYDKLERKSYQGNIVIPATIQYENVTYRVTSIGENAFALDEGLISVNIPQGVTSIGEAAFNGCTNLISATIGNSVTSIGNFAFNGCTGITSITIPNSVASIGNYAFFRVNNIVYLGTATGSPWGAEHVNGHVEGDLIYSDSTKTLLVGCATTATNVTIPNSVTSIGESAFSGCTGLTSITIPNSVTSIGQWAFNGCTGLPVENNLRYADTYLVGAVDRTKTTYNIKVGTKWVGDNAFSGCTGLTSITIPSSIKSIGESALSGCTGLTSITIPNSVTSIGRWAFNGCTGLTSITIPNGVTSIGYDAFSNCTSLTSVTWNAKNCNAYNFGSQVEQFTFGDSIQVIPEGICRSMFELTSVTIGKNVTSIGNQAFNGCYSITSVIWNAKNGPSYNFGSQVEQFILGDSVQVIPNNLCSRMSKLTSVTIPNSVTSIEHGAFYDCDGLTSITIPNSVASIGDYAFCRCSGLTSVTIPNSVTSIGNHAFYVCNSLTSVTIGNSVTSIGAEAFSGCTGLTSITIGNSVTSIGNSAFSGCTGLTSVSIPDDVTSIGSGAFSGCTGLKSVTMGNSVASIGNWAFSSCTRLTSVTIPDSVKTIGISTFEKCKGLTSITLPNNVANIGSSAFSGCIGLTSITIPNSVDSIGERAFYECTGLTSVTIPNSVTSIGESAFNSCTNLTSVTIGNSVTSIGNYAFWHCTGLTSVIIPNSVTSIGYFAFSQVNNIVYSGIATGSPWGARCVNGYADGYLIYEDTTKQVLQVCSPLAQGEINIPSSVKSIREKAFYSCTGLTSVTIPNSVTSIGESAFSGCTRITSVTWNAQNCNAYNFGTQVEQFTFGDSVQIIPYELCRDMSKLTSIIIPNSVKSIGDSAFSDCTGITSVTWNAKNCNAWNFGSQVNQFAFGDNVHVIPDGLCHGMSKLTSIIIPDSVTSIGNSAFDDCTGLTSVTIPNSVTSIGSSAFCRCNGLTSVTIGNSVTSIGNHAFYNCTSLTSVTIPNSVTSIGNSAFDDCTGLTSVTIGNSVTSIGNSAFQYCSNLTSVTIPNSVTSIGERAFYECTGLTLVTIPNSVTSIPNSVIKGHDYSAFGGCNNIKSVTWNAKNCTAYRFGNQVEQFNFGDSVQTISDGLCSDMSKLTSITIPNSVTSIGNFAFNGCTGITSITIPNNVTSIGDCAFKNCTGLTSIIIPNNVTSIGGSAFYGCSGVQSLCISSGVKSIGEYAFSGLSDKNLKNLILPDGIETIGKYAFSDCSYLKNVTFGSALEEIGENAFANDDRLLYITCYAEEPPLIMENVFPNNDAYLKVPCESKDEYKVAKGWKLFTNISCIGAEITEPTTVVKITSGDNEVTITWPTSENASAYTVEVYSNGELFCTLVFGADGVLNSVIYANGQQRLPGIKGTPKLPQRATLTNGGMRFTITGLDYATNYTYKVVTTDSNGQEIAKHIGAFATTGAVIPTYTIKTLAINGTVSGGGTYNAGENATLTATPNEHYHFVRWSDGETSATRIVTVTATATYTAEFALDQFTITFNNYDGTQLQSSKVDYGTTPSYSGQTPTKAKTAKYTYTFIGWNPTIVSVTDNATYTAAYDSVVNKYTITFKNDDGIVLQSSEVEYDQMPSYNGATPTKQATAQYTYTFAGWSPAISLVTGDATYTATYTTATEKYLVSFWNYDGTVLQSDSTLYGSIPSYTGQTPTKTKTAKYTYTFKGWNPTIISVTGDATYKAVFDSVVNKYTITFKNDNGTVLQSSEVEYDQMPAYNGATPTKQATAQHSYIFAGWSPEVALVTGEATYTATYTSTTNKYEIAFVNYDGTTLQSGQVDYGVTPTYSGQTPTKQATAKYTYTFKDWNPTIVSVIGDATYTAVFDSVVNKYTITFKNDDGTVLQSSEVEYDQLPTYNGATPTRQATAQYTYTFAGWSPAISLVKGDATYTATFTTATEKYLVSFLNYDGTVLQSDSILFGSIPNYSGTIPTKAKTAKYTYTFKGWNPSIVSVVGSATYTAVFDSVVNKYTITFKNEDGTVLQSTEVEYDQMPSYTGAIPTKQATAQYTYTFADWSPEVALVTGEATYTATYTSTTNKYEIAFVNYDGTTLQSGQVEYGVTPKYEGATPTKPKTAKYTYTFKEWNPEIDSVTSNATYKAIFDSVVNKYTITFKNEDGTILQSSEVEYDQLPVYTGVNPTKQATDQYTYTFAGWSPELALVTGDTTYMATYTETINQYTISASGENGSVTGAGTYDYGTEVTLTAIPADGYEFDQWDDGNIDNPRTILVTEDKTFVATFKAMTAVEDIPQSTSKTEKLFIDGHLYILRDGKIYTAQGAMVDER